ncbi:DUF1217 domain-containing protein [Defluviimonas sp. WL0002]|uniref:DUF1217 domain-containing protein n=1 Tax=Albidovulum marisflavi TaxID=2984159 RepID=A0ABT2Z7H8_9RHOB|nr:DUF1217 domain-containing protein [Defluviimonas sp. WL0002]MCV2867050.1 DUF1217 domain-containing protein [Defluviimonas sp. WL0002]
MGDDLKNRAFIRRILESPSGEPGALANKLADQRYREFARTFGFADPGGPRTTLPPRVEMIVSKWKEQRFGQALGTVDANMRLALHARSEITRIAGEAGTDNGRWFAVLGAAPLRQFFLTALGLPPAFSAVDIDKQVDTLRARLRSLAGVGEVSDLRDGANVEKLMRNFFLRSENEPRAGFQASALSLLSQAASATALSRRF